MNAREAPWYSLNHHCSVTAMTIPKTSFPLIPSRKHSRNSSFLLLYKNARWMTSPSGKILLNQRVIRLDIRQGLLVQYCQRADSAGQYRNASMAPYAPEPPHPPLTAGIRAALAFQIQPYTSLFGSPPHDRRKLQNKGRLTPSFVVSSLNTPLTSSGSAKRPGGWNNTCCRGCRHGW